MAQLDQIRKLRAALESLQTIDRGPGQASRVHSVFLPQDDRSLPAILIQQVNAESIDAFEGSAWIINVRIDVLKRVENKQFTKTYHEVIEICDEISKVLNKEGICNPEVGNWTDNYDITLGGVFRRYTTVGVLP